MRTALYVCLFWGIVLIMLLNVSGAIQESQHSHGTGAEPVGLYP